MRSERGVCRASAGSEPPVFVVGCPRSGTSLMAALLDRHSLLAVPPETFLFRDLYPEIRSYGTKLKGAVLLDFVRLRWPTSLLELGREEIERHLEHADPDCAELFAAMLQAYAEKQGKPRWVEKTPHHLFYVPLILRWYPEARVVCMLRDGRDVALSLVRMRWTHGNLWLHSALWNRCSQLARQYRRQYPARFRVVRFEELVAQPGSVLADLAGFINVAFEEGQLDSTMESKSVLYQELEWKGKALEPPDSGRIQAWRSTATPAERRIMSAIMNAELQRWGYAPDEEVSTTHLQRLGKTFFSAVFAARMWLYLPWIHPRVRRIQRLLRPRR